VIRLPIALKISPRRAYRLLLPDGRELTLGARTLVMGIINVTPDSFADGGLRFDRDRAVADAIQMEAQGADILDIGGESTRPGAEEVDEAEELRRVVPVVAEIARRTRTPISIDTYKPEVARAAVDAGAVIVNDVSGLRYDPTLAVVAASHRAALILMHHRGRSRRMYQEALYEDVAGEIAAELRESMTVAQDAGVPLESIVVDPGLGFAKRPAHTYEVLARLAELAQLDRPVLVGPSRKSFITAAAGAVPPAGRDWGTAAAVTAAILFGAHIVRVHAVREMVQVARVADRIREELRDLT
jgi:dihydropteroate synthase